MTDKLEEVTQQVAIDAAEATEVPEVQADESTPIAPTTSGLLSAGMPPSIMRDLQARLDKKSASCMVITPKVYDNYIKKRERARLASAKTRLAKKSIAEVIPE
jgi:hypothetical protein